MVMLMEMHGSGSLAGTGVKDIEPNQRFGKYCYMFDELVKAEASSVPFGESEAFYFDRLDDLRKTMEEYGNHFDTLSKIPAAYTYFGQFLNHDISAPVRVLSLADPSRRVIESDPDIDVLTSHRRARSPSQQLAQLRNEHTRPMTLNSLYGGGPFDKASKSLFENGTARFWLADAYDDPNMLPEHRAKLNLTGKSKFDLPRDGAGKVALIFDRRNDQNLVISQLHLAFMLFHNRAVDLLRKKHLKSGEKFLFGAARRLVTLHYQWCILNDYLDRRQTDETGTFSGIAPGALTNARGLIVKSNSVPLEFTSAAFRFGHAMVSARYDYNEVFPRADLSELFLFTSRKAMNNQQPPPGGSPQIPLHWIIDWNRFVKDPPGTAAEQINPRLASAMFDLQDKLDESKVREGFQSICLRNLRRGYHRFIPSGQKLARQLKMHPLSAEELLSGFGKLETQRTGTAESFAELLTKDQFGGAMPAWVYFLCEARLTYGGNALGPAAGAIVGETIVGLLKHNKNSVLNTQGKEGSWNPATDSELRTDTGKPINSLRRILEFAQVVASES